MTIVMPCHANTNAKVVHLSLAKLCVKFLDLKRRLGSKVERLVYAPTGVTSFSYSYCTGASLHYTFFSFHRSTSILRCMCILYDL